MKDANGQRQPTDIVDLIGETEVRRVLMQCGTDVRWVSHYELFRAFCEAQPLLVAHRLCRRCQAILSVLIEKNMPISTTVCDQIWRQTADRLLLDSIQWEAICKELPHFEYDKIADSVLKATRICLHESLFSANGLISVHAESWDTWRDRIDARLMKIPDASDSIRYRLPKRYIDRAPNPYVIGEIMKRGKRSACDLNYLHAQILRHLFAFCRTKQKRLILFAPCTPEALNALLTRLKREVGLPELICVAPIPVDPSLLDFAVENPSVSLAVDGTTLIDTDQLAQTLVRLAREYPCGRITVIRSSCDLLSKTK